MNDKPADHAIEPASQQQQAPEPEPEKVLSPAAQRALAEAAERRAAAAAPPPAAKELQGPDGPEPTRFGDWERKGIASDF
ncbi:MAG: DUF1674 domain-containing protein [Hyphomicrobiales bacterium]|nr:DUF1674 domain-containing protein [Hyphomicrobiales bacterium]